MVLGVIIVLAAIAVIALFQTLGALLVRLMDARTPPTPPAQAPHTTDAAPNDLQRARARRNARSRFPQAQRSSQAGDRNV